METKLREHIQQMESLAQARGLDYYPVEFEEVPPAFMLEISIYGLPVRMPHWSFGVRYIYQLVQHRMGHSRVFEVVFPGNPGRAYLANNNTLEENTLVVAHVLGHADFAKNNQLFASAQQQVGYHIVEQAAAHANQITHAMEVHGVALDAWHESVGAGHAERSERVGETAFYYLREERGLLEALQERPDLTYLHRPANLEDVFIKLTGRELRDG